MKLNHLNLTVKDVPAARAFFVEYMQFTSTDSKPNDTLSVLKGNDGFLLVLMNERLNQQGNNAYPDSFHIGFYLNDEAEVLSLFDKLTAAGITSGQAPQMIRKTFGFYFYLQNILVEIAAEVNHL
jgi:catechol 2,3-dioxygenase-like lactoylglutathione lyase family enzyme